MDMVVVPGEDAGSQALIEFAHTYNGYERCLVWRLSAPREAIE